MWLCQRCQRVVDTDAEPCPECGRGKPGVERGGVSDVASRQLHTDTWAADPETQYSGFGGRLRFVVSDARTWATGRSWPLRVLATAWIAWAGWNHLIDPAYNDITGGLTMVIHELGHAVTGWAPEGVCVASGSVFQVLAPLYIFFSFLKQREYFGLSFALFWLASSLYGMAVYIGDSRVLQLDLVSLSHSGEVIHDWNYMLDAVGMLQYDLAIGGFVRLLAAGVMIAAVTWGVWISSVMISTRGAVNQPEA
ncbi:MAG TPA: hypothetical protein VGK19_25805 [Capsulimonadaceae bacterium]|jgi:hypothetical protein